MVAIAMVMPFVTSLVEDCGLPGEARSSSSASWTDPPSRACGALVVITRVARGRQAAGERALSSASRSRSRCTRAGTTGREEPILARQ